MSCRRSLPWGGRCPRRLRSEHRPSPLLLNKVHILNVTVSFNNLKGKARGTLQASFRDPVCGGWGATRVPRDRAFWEPSTAAEQDARQAPGGRRAHRGQRDGVVGRAPTWTLSLQPCCTFTVSNRKGTKPDNKMCIELYIYIYIYILSLKYSQSLLISNVDYLPQLWHPQLPHPG